MKKKNGIKIALLCSLITVIFSLSCENPFFPGKKGIKAGTLWVSPTGIEFVYIPAGKFTMGSPADERGRETWENQVNVKISKGFYMGKYEVTQEEWALVMAGSENEVRPSHFDDRPGREPAPGEIQGKRPVESITWYDAIEFCNILSDIEGFDPVYQFDNINRRAWGMIFEADVTADFSKNGYRLPTEAQWEYACRAGTKTAFYNGNNYDSGTGYDDALIGQVAWFENNSDNISHQVGLKKPNAWGLYDMHGNVEEWCYDSWDGSSGHIGGKDPISDDPSQRRIMRGGTYEETEGIRSAYRFRMSAGSNNEDMGFRIIRPAQ